MLGVVRTPSLFSITRTSLPSMIATQELVVPRSMPMTLLILNSFAADRGGPRHRLYPRGCDAQDVFSATPRGKGGGAYFASKTALGGSIELLRARSLTRIGGRQFRRRRL